jgi:hypothetical protein
MLHACNTVEVVAPRGRRCPSHPAEQRCIVLGPLHATSRFPLSAKSRGQEDRLLLT